MSTALFAMSRVIAPLQRLRCWFAPDAALRPTRAPEEAPVRQAALPSIHRPLRIVRIMEADQAPSHVGRIIISGRMADVCAELDRLAALH